MPATTSGMTTEQLAALFDAFNRHDADAVMTFMTDDCVFDGAAGPEAHGARYQGRDAVRTAFAEVWATFRDARWDCTRHTVTQELGVSEWTFSGTRADGARIEAEGCDLFTFRAGRIALKRAFRKQRPLLEPNGR